MPPFTLSGNTMTTFEPFFTCFAIGSTPMGFWIDARVAASISSSTGGSGTVSPGIKTSVHSGSSASIMPRPYSNENFMGFPLRIQILLASKNFLYHTLTNPEEPNILIFCLTSDLNASLAGAMTSSC